MELLPGESGLDTYLLPALVSVLILIQYYAFIMLCGAARARSGIEAPACTGDPDFERAFRVQQNTLEQLVAALPALWLCAVFFRPDVASICGVTFILGRFLYRAGYISDPKKRGPGMIIGMLAIVVMVFSSLWGVMAALL